MANGIHRTIAYYGAKTRQMKNLLPLLPHTQSYVELFTGTASVFLNKPMSKSSVLNDKDDVLVTMMDVIRRRPQELADQMALTLNARTEFARCDYNVDDELEIARQALVVIRTSLLHSTKIYTGRQSKKWCISYMPCIKHFGNLRPIIMEMADRLQHAQIECRDALSVLQRANRDDGADMLIYADPPYHASARDSGSCDTYRCEMKHDEHVALLEELRNSPHRCAISGYRSELYDDMLCDWHLHTWSTITSSSKGNSTREECCWTNYLISESCLL